MPSKERYQRMKEAKFKCPKCNGVLDDKKYTTCSRCRGRLGTIVRERRESMMSLFGIKK